MNAIDAEAFTNAVALLIGRPTRPDERLALAVSGGPDSLAMLLLAAETGMSVAALTVDHGLRHEAAAEAAYVADICTTRGIPHNTLKADVDRGMASVQAAARAARYAAMGAWCDASGVRWLLTAHHADDQAETLLMRLSRAAGLAGMSGIRARRSIESCSAELLRPLLAVPKSELGKVVEAAGLVPVDDPSNRDTAYDRTAVRELLMGGGIDAVRAAATAAHLAEADAALEWTAREAWAGRAVLRDDTVELDAHNLPAELIRRLVLQAISSVCADTRTDGPALTRLIAGLEAGVSGNLGDVAAEPGKRWRFRRAPPRQMRQSGE